MPDLPSILERPSTLAWQVDLHGRPTACSYSLSAHGDRYIVYRHIGRWRLGLDVTSRSAPEVLWEDDDEQSCKDVADFIETHDLVCRRHEERLADIHGKTLLRKSKVAPEVTLEAGFWGVDARLPDGFLVGSVQVNLSPWTSHFVCGRLTINCSSYIEFHYRHRGLGREMYDLAETYFGLPMVPQGTNGVPGTRSPEALRFWTGRTSVRPVPGFFDPEANRRAEIMTRLKTITIRERLHLGDPYFALMLGDLCDIPVAGVVCHDDDLPSGANDCVAWCVLPDGRTVSSAGIMTVEDLLERHRHIRQTVSPFGQPEQPAVWTPVDQAEIATLYATGLGQAGGRRDVEAFFWLMAERMQDEVRSLKQDWSDNLPTMPAW